MAIGTARHCFSPSNSNGDSTLDPAAEKILFKSLIADAKLNIFQFIQ
jgi:hypothetical protein